VLTVTDGTHTAHINLVGNFLSSVFTCSNDGVGGVLIVDPPAPPPAPAAVQPHAFASAAAALAPSAAGSTAPAPHLATAPPPALVSPRSSFA
jgi:hypothetical protein